MTSQGVTCNQSEFGATVPDSSTWPKFSEPDEATALNISGFTTRNGCTRPRLPDAGCDLPGTGMTTMAEQSGNDALLKSGTLSPNPWDLTLSGQNDWQYNQGTRTEDKAPQGCDPSAASSAGMARRPRCCSRPQTHRTTTTTELLRLWSTDRHQRHPYSPETTAYPLPESHPRTSLWPILTTGIDEKRVLSG